MKVIKLEDVMKLLELDTLNKKEHTKPRHGSCCCCQTCGHYHDECVCEHNYLVNEISKVSIEIKED